MLLTAEKLLAIARHYWPEDMETYLRPEKSPAFARRHAVWERELGKMDRWNAWVDGLRQELPDWLVGNVTAPGDGSFRCAAYSREGRTPPDLEWIVIGCLSVLAPVYTVYGMRCECRGRRRIRKTVFFDALPPDIQGPAELMARRLQESFDVQALPREIANTRVPLIVDPVMPPDTTLFHALFVSEPERVH
ncbi:hypothetical protein [Archangium sp.]|uniref:hypothetical protein n=1 Tax=Archangium sp. TaxID=1872627 RepID=UPI00286AA989|nr:hypothetical protein [Archangium sp.]